MRRVGQRPAKNCTVVCGSNSLEELALWLGLVDVDVTVHEPVKLRDRLRMLGARLAHAAG